MANFKNISEKAWKKLSEEQQKGFKEVIEQGFLGMNKKSMENKTEEGRAAKLDRDISKKNLKLMSGLWKQSKITSTAVKVTSSHWGKLLALGMFLLPKKFWIGLGETLIRVFNFFKNFDFKKIKMWKVIAGFTALAALLHPKAALTLALIGFKTMLLGFEGMKFAKNMFTKKPPVGGIPLGPRLPKDLAHAEAMKTGGVPANKPTSSMTTTKGAKGSFFKKKMVPILGKAGRILGWVGVGISAADAIGKGFFSENMKGKSFGDKITTTLGHFASNMTLGLVDAKWTKNLLDNIGKTIKDGVINGASAITKGVVAGLEGMVLGLDSVAKHISDGFDFVRNFDWDKEVKRLKDARKDPVKKGDLKGAGAQVEHLTNVAQTRELTDTEKGQLKTSQKQLGQEPLGELKVGSDEKQKEGIRKEIARREKVVANAQKKHDDAKGSAKKVSSFHSLNSAKKELVAKKNELKNFGVGPSSTPIVTMGSASSGKGLPISPKSIGIDWDFINKKEGGSKLNGYVPDPKGSKSGVTIATGFDLGARGPKDLKGLSPDLQAKLAPYLGLQKQDAVSMLGQRPLKITAAEAKEIDAMSKGGAVKKLRAEWNKRAKELGGNAKMFGELSSSQQTVAASVAFQYGSLSKTPDFRKAMQTGNWSQAVKELENFGDKYESRRMTEAAYLKNDSGRRLQELNSQTMMASNGGGGTTIVAPTTNNNSSQATTAMLSNPSAANGADPSQQKIGNAVG